MARTEFDFQPVIIIGAARSGTNMLRDMLAQISGAGTWPCDEINYIWRHHNAASPNDEFTPQHATPSAVRYIRGAFRKMAQRTNSRILIEKTCANSLRVGFVDAVIPEAKYLFIVRDGRDVVHSALKRWKAPLEPKYLMKKIPFVPWTDFPYYALNYAWHRLYRLVSREKRLKSWGPRFTGMQQLLVERPLDEVCALQWQRAVERADEALVEFPSDRVHVLRYEDMVGEPGSSFDSVLRFLNLTVTEVQRAAILGGVFADSVGGWRRKMTDERRQRINVLIGTTLAKFGYETDSATSDFRAA